MIYDFKGCASGGITSFCPNKGDWGCSPLFCIKGNSGGETGFCEVGGTVHFEDCFTQKNIKYLEIFFYAANKPSAFRDWIFLFYNIPISGKGSSVFVDTTEYVLEKSFIGTNVTIGMVFDYNVTNCNVVIQFYANGTLAFTDYGTVCLDIYNTNNVIEIIVIPQQSETHPTFLVSAHTFQPTPEQIMERALMEGEIPVDYEVCHTFEECLCVGGTEADTEVDYRTLAIVLGVFLAIVVVILALLLLWWIIRFFSRPTKGYTGLVEG
jgi:hypothetical protein